MRRKSCSLEHLVIIILGEISYSQLILDFSGGHLFQFSLVVAFLPLPSSSAYLVKTKLALIKFPAHPHHRKMTAIVSEIYFIMASEGGTIIFQSSNRLENSAGYIESGAAYCQTENFLLYCMEEYSKTITIGRKRLIQTQILFVICYF